jgi:hypothetical protein
MRGDSPDRSEDFLLQRQLARLSDLNPAPYYPTENKPRNNREGSENDLEHCAKSLKIPEFFSSLIPVFLYFSLGSEHLHR